MIIDLNRYHVHIPLVKRMYSQFLIDKGLDYVVSNTTIAAGMHIIATCYYIKYLIDDSDEINMMIDSLKEFYRVELVSGLDNLMMHGLVTPMY